jgi:hypothetical protein
MGRARHASLRAMTVFAQETRQRRQRGVPSPFHASGDNARTEHHRRGFTQAHEPRQPSLRHVPPGGEHGAKQPEAHRNDDGLSAVSHAALPRPSRHLARTDRIPSESDSFDADSLCMGCQRFQIVWIGGEYRSARLCERDDDGVDRGSSAGFAMPLSLARHPTFAKGRAARKRHGGQSSADENAPRLAPANEPNANSGSPATWRTGALKAAAVAHSARSFSSRPHRARPW